MEINITLKILKQRLDRGLSAEIHVQGDSMHPILYEHDKIGLVKSDIYCVGDVLVFQYAQHEFLVHRLLLMRDCKYYCKGDNSFRLEEVESANIFGKVVSICRNGVSAPLPDVCDVFINHSLQVNHEFQRYRNNYAKTTDTEIYKRYYKKYIAGNALFIHTHIGGR